MRSNLTLSVAAALLLAACHGGGKKASLPADASTGIVGVRVVKPKAGEAALTRATAELRARREAVLSPEISGRIARTIVDIGDRVQKGQALLELSSSTAALQAERIKLHGLTLELIRKDPTRQWEVAELERLLKDAYDLDTEEQSRKSELAHFKAKAGYEALAVELAANPPRIARIRQKLTVNRLTAPLFDTPRFARNIEAAYVQMHERWLAGLPPDHIQPSPAS